MTATPRISDAIGYRRMSLLAVFFLVLLRMTIGYHFFVEGWTKVRSKNFSSQGFLNAAKGPLAEHYRGLITDHDGRYRLQFLLFAAEDFSNTDEAGALGKDSKLQKEYVDTQKAISIAELKRWQKSLDTLLPSLEPAVAESLRLAVRQYHEEAAERYVFSSEQSKDLAEAIARSKWELGSLYLTHSKAIGEYLNGFGRLDKLSHDPMRDGMYGVSSLAAQAEDVRTKWQGQIRPVLSDIDRVVKNMEGRMQSIATAEQQVRVKPLKKEWPKAGPLSLEMVDQIIPIFDMVIGILLLLGLLTPIASFAAGAFLLSVVLSQFPGYPGTQPTYFQAVEAIACFFLAFSDAGRFGGLDYLSWTWWKLRKFGGWQPD